MAVLQGLQAYNQKMLTMAEHWDEFIMDKSQKQPNVWHDRISRGVYPLFAGLTQKSNIFRGGLPVQAGLSTWNKIQLSQKGNPGFDNCAPGTPPTYSYAWETVQYEGYQDEWQSEPVCLNDLKFVDYAKEQLTMVVRTGVNYGISILENWNREMYVLQAVNANRTMILIEGALGFEDSADFRFTYDPFLVDSAGDTYITFPAGAKVSTLNWSFLDYVRQSLADRAGEAALSSESGMPVFGLMIDMADFERMVREDDKLREEFLYADPKALIKGYDLGIKVFRGMALFHDQRQMRFKVSSVTSTVVTAKRVKPLRAGRAVTIGNVPEPNPEYYQAELGVAVIFMNDVLQNLFAPNLTNLGSGMTFGPAPGFTGDWKWINIPDPVSNMNGETGFFYGRFQIWPKPLLFSAETTVVLYRRCPHSWVTGCEIQGRSDVATAAVALAVATVEADVDATNLTVALTLAQKLDVAVGDTVTIKKDDSNTFVATVAEDALAPTYTFAWVSGASQVPTGTAAQMAALMNDTAIVTVTA